MARALVLGGTRDIGYFAALELLAAGHAVSVLNRGHTSDELPAGVERLRADRTHPRELADAVGGREFDLVLDTTTYDAANAHRAIESFSGRVGRYVFISTGQVYLVRAAIERPFREEDYDGPLIPEPEPGTTDHDSWRYGVEKRDAEEAFGAAWATWHFPVTTLRIPVVASERDPAGRVQAYVARLLDGGPLLVPAGQALRLRHVYVRDLARFIATLPGRSEGIGEALNISSAQSLALSEFLALLGEVVGVTPRLVEADRALLEGEALLPDCSPFSSRWMSELDNRLGLERFGPLGLRFLPAREYLESIVRDYRDRWVQRGIEPYGYSQRPRELEFTSGMPG